MKKLVSICLLTLISFNVLAFSFHHRSSAPQISKNKTIIDGDFSGSWAGQCSDEKVSLNIEQNDEKITIDWIFIEGQSKDIFYLNTVKTKQSSTDKLSKVYTKFAYLSENRLYLKQNHLELLNSVHGKGFYESNLNVLFTKNGDSIEISDYLSEGAVCSLSRQSK